MPEGKGTYGKQVGRPPKKSTLYKKSSAFKMKLHPLPGIKRAKESPHKFGKVFKGIRAKLDKHIPSRKGYTGGKPSSTSSTTSKGSESSKSGSFWSKLINK